MKHWQLRLLVLFGIASGIIAIVSFVLFWNPIGLAVVGMTTGLLIAIFPSIPWFLPPIVIWLLIFIALTGVVAYLMRPPKKI